MQIAGAANNFTLDFENRMEGGRLAWKTWEASLNAMKDRPKQDWPSYNIIRKRLPKQLAAWYIRKKWILPLSTTKKLSLCFMPLPIDVVVHWKTFRRLCRTEANSRPFCFIFRGCCCFCSCCRWQPRLCVWLLSSAPTSSSSGSVIVALSTRKWGGWG